MDVLRPRHLVFEDLSVTLTRPMLSAEQQLRQQLTTDNKPESMEELVGQLGCLASTLQDAHGAMQKRMDEHKRAALDQLEATGGRMALSSHLKAQKDNWKFVGQKAAFLERLITVTDCQEQQDFSSDIAIANKAVDTLKEELRDRNISVSKVEQQLMGMIQQIARMYDTGNSMAGQLAMQLPRIAAELEEYKAGRQQPPEPLVDGMSEVEILRLVAEEEARAAQLEQQAAHEAANRAAADAEYAARMAHTRQLREDVVAMEEECNAAAKKQGAKYAEQFDRYDAMAAAVSRTLGVELASHGESGMDLTITQTIPRAMPGREQLPSFMASASGAGFASQDRCDKTAEAGSIGAVVAEHVLSLEMGVPGSGILSTATLNPPAVDIDDVVRAAQTAQEAGDSSALDTLVLDIKSRLYMHCRRQLQLEDAHELYPLQATSISPELLRCVLPNKVEVEVSVPMDWPEAGSRLQLMQLQASQASQDFTPLLARLKQELDEVYLGTGSSGVQAEVRRRQLQGCSLREMLDWVYSSLVAEQGK